jgi:WW domain-binding protein 11
VEAPKLNEKVLKDKRRKLKETFQRVLRLYVLKTLKVGWESY